MNTQTQIVTGSIADIATRNNQSIAETFLSCDCVVLIDVSAAWILKTALEKHAMTAHVRLSKTCKHRCLEKSQS